MFSIRVNNTNEEVGYVLYDETVYSRDVGGVIHTYELSGPGEILYYSADRVSGAIYYNLYAEYSIDGSSWTLAHDNTNIGTSYKDFSCAIPETARYVRFQLPFGGTLNKHIKDVKVPRKTYVRASADKTDLGTVLTGSTAQASFTVDYSTTNGGNIHVNSSNPNFVVSESELSVDNHSDGTKTFTVTYTPNPEQLGEESALITVSDLFYTQEITLQAIAAKQDNTLKVVGDQDLKVGDIIGLNEKSILAKGDLVQDTTVSLIEKMMTPDIVNITLFYGKDVAEEDANKLTEELQAKFPDCEVNTISGGQPVYYYIISLE
jgi:hypothetical protein